MATIDELFASARSDVDSGWLPACQLAVARDGEVVAHATFGDAGDETRFCIFSATKPIVASAVWILMQEGALDIERPVVDYIPEFGAGRKEHVTVEQVLLHTAGFPNAEMPWRDGNDAAARAKVFASWELEWEPGTRFEYHALAAHWVLADLIERLAGVDYRDFVEQRVCAPHGIGRVLGVRDDEQARCASLVSTDAGVPLEPLMADLDDPACRAVGIPGGGAFMTAPELARFYQALLHNPAGVWDPATLADVTTNIRCTFADPIMGVAANRTVGLVLAGDDGLHELRYAIFGKQCSPGAFGHAGAHAQIAWADPATGISFAYLTNGIDRDMMREAIRGNGLSTLASELSL